MSAAREAICSNFGRVEQTLQATRPAADSDEARRLCTSQLTAATRMNCQELGVMRDEPGSVVNWYCSPQLETNPMAVPAAPPGASAYERARRNMCTALANEEFDLLNRRPAWNDPDARRYCEDRAELSEVWSCGEFGVFSGAPGSASHWYCATAPEDTPVPEPREVTARSFVATPPQPPPPPPQPPQDAAQRSPGSGIVAQAQAPSQGPSQAQAQAPSQAQAQAARAAMGNVMMMMGGMGGAREYSMMNTMAPPPAAYGPYVQISNPQTGVNAFCRMNLDHQIYVCDTPVHGAFVDAGGNPIVCDRASWMCKPAEA